MTSICAAELQIFNLYIVSEKSAEKVPVIHDNASDFSFEFSEKWLLLIKYS